ncbi:hypothetical protein D3C80_2133920 [compost metagenome]
MHLAGKAIAAIAEVSRDYSIEIGDENSDGLLSAAELISFYLGRDAHELTGKTWPDEEDERVSALRAATVEGEQ